MADVSLTAWSVWNTEPTVPSTEKTRFIHDMVRVGLTNKAYYFQVYDTPLGNRWLDALKDNLAQKRILEKNFCFLGWASSTRDVNFLCGELNKSIEQINSFTFDPPYEKIHPFRSDDFQYSAKLKTGLCPDGNEMSKPGLRLKHDACNLLHRYFEELQGTAWEMSEYYKQSDRETKYAIRQLNNLCHEIESWVLSHRKSVVEPEWMRPSQITTFLNAPRYDLHDGDFELFKQNRYDRDLGGVYLHWSQVGKTLYEVFRDEHGPKMTDALCSEINHQKYYSGEFDVEWGKTITEKDHGFKKDEMDRYRKWLDTNGYDWEDPKLSLGYIKIGQIDLVNTFGGANFQEIYQIMNSNLNISSIKIVSEKSTECEYPYSLDDANWKNMQLEGLKNG